MLTNSPVSCTAAIGELRVSMASFISLLILNKATTQPGTHWPLQPQMIASAADEFYNMEAQLVLCIKRKKKNVVHSNTTGSTVDYSFNEDYIYKTL